MCKCNAFLLPKLNFSFFKRNAAAHVQSQVCEVAGASLVSVVAESVDLATANQADFGRILMAHCGEADHDAAIIVHNAGTIGQVPTAHARRAISPWKNHFCARKEVKLLLRTDIDFLYS